MEYQPPQPAPGPFGLGQDESPEPPAPVDPGLWFPPQLDAETDAG